MLPIKRKFRDAIRRGTGDAFFILKANPGVDFSKDILRAGIYNLAYDAQSEGSRGQYIVQLLGLVQQKDKIVKRLLEELVAQKDDDWGTHQLCDIVGILAAEGNDDARRALYKRFELSSGRAYKVCGQEAIIKLDGLDGLLRVARIRGKMLARDSEDWEDDSLIETFLGAYPDIKAWAVLRKAAKTDADIAAYLKRVESTKSIRKSRPKLHRAYDEVAERIQMKRPLFSVVKRLSERDVYKLANDMLKESDPKKQIRYLSVFRKRKFPLDYRHIITIAKDAQKSGMTGAMDEALDALRFFSSEEIREYAIYNLKKGKSRYLFAKLLIHNYRKGDNKILVSLIERNNDIIVVEAMANICREIYEQNKIQDSKRPLEAIYNKLTCGICRADIVRLLIENGVISTRIKKEIAYDSYEETRAMAE